MQPFKIAAVPVNRWKNHCIECVMELGKGKSRVSFNTVTQMTFAEAKNSEHELNK